MSPRSRTRLAVAVFVALLLALVVYSTLGLGGYSCEVCMEFGGRTQCRKAIGSTQQESLRTAIDNACALLASGVTDSIRCTNTPPKSSSCEKTR